MTIGVDEVVAPRAGWDGAADQHAIGIQRDKRRRRADSVNREGESFRR